MAFATGGFKVVITLGSESGLVEDNCVNVLHVGEDAAVPDPDDLIAPFIAFYNSVPTGDTQAVGQDMAESISRTANKCRIDVYQISDLSGATPLGSPVAGQNWTLIGSDAGGNLPEEVATVLSYHGDLDVPVSQVNPTPPPATIRPQARRRGRMYIGPLLQSTGSTAGLHYRPNSGWRIRCTRAFKDLANDITAIDPLLWLGVWSKADADIYPVEGGYMDDAWDTQRRRGVAPTTRSNFVVP